MFYFISKAFDFLLMPLSLLFLMMAYALFKLRKSGGRWKLLPAICLLYVISNNFIVNSAFLHWEHPQKNIRDVTKIYDTGILLTGGIIHITRLQTDHASLGGSSDRLLQTYLLYKAGKIRNILISGTDNPKLLERNLADGQQSKALLVSWGVPESVIFLEDKSRNTRENAIFSARFLQENKLKHDNTLIITSAFHLKRAVGCFKKAGLKVDAFPCDFYGGQFDYRFKRLFIPDGQALGNFTLLWHEFVGYTVYSLMGYC